MTIEESYLRWALEERKREQVQGFPTLQTFPNGIAPRFLNFCEHLESSDVELFGVELLLGRLVDKCGLRAIVLPERSDRGRSLVAEFYASVLTPTAEEWKRRSSGAEQEAQSASRKKMLDTILTLVGANVGTLVRRSRTSVLIRTKVAVGFVNTYIDTGGRIDQITYWQELESEGEMPLGRTSVLPWLGLSGQTGWSDLRKEEFTAVAGRMRILLEDFILFAKRLE